MVVYEETGEKITQPPQPLEKTIAMHSPGYFIEHFPQVFYMLQPKGNAPSVFVCFNALPLLGVVEPVCCDYDVGV